MKLSEIMNSPVVVTQENKSVDHVRGLIDRKNINAIPVLNMDGEIRGIVTSNDIARESDGNKSIAQIMTPRVAVLTPSSGISDAARMMVDRGIHHIVAMEDGQVVGIVSSLDLVDILSEQ